MKVVKPDTEKSQRVVSISYDDNHYTTSTFCIYIGGVCGIYIYIYIYIYISQLRESRVSSHREELRYNETVFLWMTRLFIYILSDSSVSTSQKLIIISFCHQIILAEKYQKGWQLLYESIIFIESHKFKSHGSAFNDDTPVLKENLEYAFIAITSRSTLTRSSSTG